MKRLSIWYVTILTLLIGFTSCEQIEDFNACPEMRLAIENDEGSSVYRFMAQLDGLEDMRFSWFVDGEKIDSGNLNDIASQILDYRFEPGKHKVCVKAEGGECPIEVCKEIDVIRDETNPCPDLFFKVKQHERPSHYKFIADFPNMEQTPYEWFINGEVVASHKNTDNGYLYWEFNEPGTYEVCIKTETPDCPNGASYCKEIVVENVSESCPEVSFTAELSKQTGGTKYVFSSKVEGTDQVAEYQWYVNGELIEKSTDPAIGKNFDYRFEAGVHKVCLKVITEDCPEGAIYCKEIEVKEQGCPQLSFVKEQDGDNSAYYFYPDFEGMEHIEWLGWYVDGVFVQDHDNTSNGFYYQFVPGSYEVCLKTETPECPEGASFCKTVVIESPISCPDLSFTIEQEGSTPGYNFWANFNDLAETSYNWTVNGDIVDREIVGSGNEKDDYMYYQFGQGTYEICVTAETPDCPNGVSFCKTLVIE